MKIQYLLHSNGRGFRKNREPLFFGVSEGVELEFGFIPSLEYLKENTLILQVNEKKYRIENASFIFSPNTLKVGSYSLTLYAVDGDRQIKSFRLQPLSIEDLSGRLAVQYEINEDVTNLSKELLAIREDFAEHANERASFKSEFEERISNLEQTQTKLVADVVTLFEAVNNLSENFEKVKEEMAI